MVHGKIKDDGKVHFSFDKCDGMSIHYIAVDEDWFNEHNTEDIDAETLDKMAHEDRENSKVSGRISWWGLG